MIRRTLLSSSTLSGDASTLDPSTIRPSRAHPDSTFYISYSALSSRSRASHCCGCNCPWRSKLSTNEVPSFATSCSWRSSFGGRQSDSLLTDVPDAPFPSVKRVVLAWRCQLGLVCCWMEVAGCVPSAWVLVTISLACPSPASPSANSVSLAPPSPASLC